MKAIRGIMMMSGVLFCLWFVSASPAFSQETDSQQLTAQEIVKRSDDLLRGDTSTGTYKMSVTTPNWSRTLELYAVSKAKE